MKKLVTILILAFVGGCSYSMVSKASSFTHQPPPVPKPYVYLPGTIMIGQGWQGVMNIPTYMPWQPPLVCADGFEWAAVLPMEGFGLFNFVGEVSTPFDACEGE